jgi:hypothetical protein
MKKGLNLFPWANVRKRDHTVRQLLRCSEESCGAMTTLKPCGLSAKKQGIELGFPVNEGQIKDPILNGGFGWVCYYPHTGSGLNSSPESVAI